MAIVQEYDPPATKYAEGIHRVQIAPMLDVSYSMFRSFIRLMTKRSQIWTEMVVDQVLTHNASDPDVLFEHLEFRPKEEPMVLQLGGSNPSYLAEATRIAYNYGYQEEINLNAGCPSCRVAGKGEFGAALMKKPSVIQECLTAMALAAPVRISLKTRLGVDDYDSDEFFNSFVDTILETPLPSSSRFSLVVHARKAWLNGLSPAQNRIIPPLNYERAFSICGSKPGLNKWYLNGGINTLTDALSILNRGPANLEGVMMGRAAMNTPVEFANTDTLLYGEDTAPLAARTRRTLLEAYCEYLHDRYPLDEVPKTGTVFTAMKPVLGVFFGQKGNRQWRNTLDQMSRNTEARRSLGVAGIMEETMKEMDPDVLDEKLTLE